MAALSFKEAYAFNCLSPEGKVLKTKLFYLFNFYRMSARPQPGKLTPGPCGPSLFIHVVAVTRSLPSHH